MHNGIKRGYALTSITMKKVLLFLTFLMFICSSYAQSEIVYLKNGKVIRGSVIEQSPGANIKVRTSNGSLFAYQYSDVARIVEDNTPARRSGNGLRLGYKGFVDFGYTLGVGDYSADRAEAYTTHGCQINNVIFVGVGAGVNYYYDNDNAIGVPVYANARFTFLNKRITPFADTRVGYSLVDVEGIYGSQAIGCRFRLGDRTAFNVSVAYTLLNLQTEFSSGDFRMKEDKISNAVTFRLGFEF
jgi:hypothetical protein